MRKKQNIIWANTNRSRQIRMQGPEFASVLRCTYTSRLEDSSVLRCEAARLISKFSNITMRISDLLFPILLKCEDNILT